MQPTRGWPCPCRRSHREKRVGRGDRARSERFCPLVGHSEVENVRGSGCQPEVEPGVGRELTGTLAPMPAQDIVTDSRSVTRWAGSHADLKAVNDSLSDCFEGMRRREQSEWEADNPAPEELRADASNVEKMTAEHLLLIREIRRMTRDDRFTGYCCFELANRPLEVMGSYEEALPSLNNDRINFIHMRHRYSRDDSWLNATVYFESQRAGILVEGTNPFWVESAADLLEERLRVRRPVWAPLVSRWGYWLSQLAFGGLVAAIVWRVTDRLGRTPPWWGLLGAVLISLLVMGNPKFLSWLLPNVDIYAPASRPTGTTHLGWVGGAIAVAVLGLVADTLLRG